MKAFLFLAFFTAKALTDSGPMDPSGNFDHYKLERGHSEDKDEEWNKFQAAAQEKVAKDYSYTQDNVHFSRFFNLSGQDVDKALALFNESLEFRKQYNVTGLPISRGSYNSKNDKGVKRFQAKWTEKDRKNRTVLYLNVGSWALKTALAKGEGPDYEGALYRIMEAGMIAQYESIRQGCNYSRFNVFINYDGWTVEEGGAGCLECAPYVSRIAKNIMKVWPDTIDEIGLLNTIPEVETFIDTIKSTLPEPLLKRIYIYGRNQKEWFPKVEALLDKRALKKLLRKPKH